VVLAPDYVSRSERWPRACRIFGNGDAALPIAAEAVSTYRAIHVMPAFTVCIRSTP
jgi:hypothetical protein